jgi:hypothetical protein
LKLRSGGAGSFSLRRPCCRIKPTVGASQNLNIPFADLKSQSAGGEGLEGAIHALKPDADAAAEARRAEQQARSDLKPQG